MTTTNTIRKPFLMGAETEYAVSGLRGDQGLDPDDVYDLLVEALKPLRAWVCDHQGYRGMYLQHGGRLYLDYGSHPEHATPECHTPRQVALADKAGEFLLGLGREVAMSLEPGLKLRVIKNNLDPVAPDHTTYGTHESYTLWGNSSVAGPQLIPHLVSRMLYAGAGGLTGHEWGIGFELSQRARHLHVAEGDDTTCNRAIFGTRLRKESDNGDNWIRVHLICKDAQRAPFGTYLTYATTGMLIEMINHGLSVGQRLTLVHPVQAVKAISHDPFCRVKVELADGRRLSALEIQAGYLEECEKALQRGVLGEWASEAIGHWRATLTALERDPRQLADRLDPYCKLLICEHELLRAGYDWPDLRQALSRLHALRSGHGERIVRAVLNDSDAGLTTEEHSSFVEACDEVQVRKPGMLDRLLFATRLQALDFHYHEVGGLYDRLHDAGRMRDLILTPADIEVASRTPPPGGRSAVRGEWIRQHQGEENWRGDWQFVWQAKTGECVDLRNPFSGERRAVQLALPANTEPWHIDVLDVLSDMEAAANAEAIDADASDATAETVDAA